MSPASRSVPERVTIGGAPLTVEDVVAVARHGVAVDVDPGALERVRESRRVVEQLLGREDPEYGITGGHEKVGRTRISVEELHEEEGGRVAYGITTGFGELARVRIPAEDVEELQQNLVRSHACGVGEPLPDEVVRGILLLRANALGAGLSGVRRRVVETLAGMVNEGVVPVVPSRGSLGASGDLVPLAHVALVLMGEGEAVHRGARHPGGAAMQAAGLQPLTLQAKEGLALINGTQGMAALLALSSYDGAQLVRAAEIAGAMTLEALMGSTRPFDERIHRARPHPGQLASAANLRRLVEGSGIVESHAHCNRVQDAYSLRCMPQVYGAVRTALTHARSVLEIEFGSATDNPLVFPEGETVSGGNFHGEPLALLAAYLAPAFAEVGALSERRTARLVDPRLSEGLPAFLTRGSGLHSGLMIPQYVQAALVLENQGLAHPAAVGNLPTSANQEDFNSNGFVGALNARKILENAQRVVAIELVAAAQAIECRAPLEPGRGTRAALAAVREAVPTLEGDRVLAPDLDAAWALVRDGTLVDAVEAAVGSLE